nr:hypothetical protein [uncultured bacterium]
MIFIWGSKTADSIVANNTSLYLKQKATIQSIPSVATKIITNYDNITSSNFTLNNITGGYYIQRIGEISYRGLYFIFC